MDRMIRFLVVAAAPATLACCATTDYAAVDDAQCRQWGTAPGTDVYVQCRSRLVAKRDADDALVQSVTANAMAGALLEQSRAAPAPPAGGPRIDCRSTTLGASTYTTCR